MSGTKAIIEFDLSDSDSLSDYNRFNRSLDNSVLLWEMLSFIRAVNNGKEYTIEANLEKLVKDEPEEIKNKMYKSANLAIEYICNKLFELSQDHHYRDE